MEDENMINKTNFLNVQSASNYWLIRKSKRYPNQIYYFNTMTRQSLWNLSEQEIQKAKQKTQINDQQKGFLEPRIHDFPEPLGPPIDILQSLNKPNSSHTVTPNESSIFNKDLTHNQMSNTVVRCCCIVGHTSCSQSNSSELIKNNMNMEQQRNNEGYRDLRELIFKKKCLRKSEDNSIKVNVEPIKYPAESNCNIHKNIMFEEHKTLEKFKLDISRLTLLADEKFNTWFMVLDSSVLLHYDVTHIDFLQLLLHTDERCRVVVPKRVLAEVREAAAGGATRLASLAYRANRYLNQLLDQDIAFIGPEPTMNNDPNKTHIIRCCLKLYEENLPVILLTEETNIIEETSLIPIFSMQKLKEFLSADTSNKKNYANDFMNKIPVALNRLTIDNVVDNSNLNVLKNTDTNPKFDINLSKRHLTDKIPVELNSYAVSNVVDNSDAKIIRTAYTQSENDFTNKVPMATNVLTMGTIAHKSDSRNLEITATQPKKDINLNFHDFAHKVPIEKNSLTIDSVARNTNPINLKNIDHHSKQNVNDVHSGVPVERHCLTVDNVVEGTRKLKNTDDQPKQNSCLNVKDVKSPVKTKTVDNVKDASENVKNTEPPPKKRTIRLNRNITHSNPSSSGKIRNFKWRSKRLVNNNSKEMEKQFKDMCTQTQQDGEHINKLVLEKSSQSQQCDEQIVQRSTVDFSSLEIDTRMDDSTDSRESFNVFQKKSDENVIVEESSTSGVISNSISNMDSDSERCFEENGIILFEIKDTVMEEHLRTGREEWLSQFVQIMEEVLTQVLEKDPQFFEESMPPPWLLHEAATCISRKFNGQADIMKAAKKLVDHVHNVSDYKGKIDVNMTPTDFMKMYSYGVYLVYTLQTHLDNNEDLQNAALSLAKLLYDIENPKRDFPHRYHKSRDLKSAIPDKVNNRIRRDGLSDNFLGLPPANNNKKYKSTKNIGEVRKEVSDYITSIEKEKSYKMFFSTLNLRKNAPSTKESLSREAINDSPSKINDPAESQTNTPQLEQGIGNNTNSNDNNDTATKEKIVFKITRTFNKCPEFEEKLKQNGLQSEEIYAEENTEEQCYSPHNNDDEYSSDDSYVHNSSSMDDSEELLDEFFKSFIRETKNTLRILYDFCCKVTEELKNNAKDRTSNRMNEIQKDLKLYKIEVQSLSSSLKSIFERNITQFKAELELAGVNNFLPNEVQIQKYRQAVEMCMNQANILIEIIEELLRVST